MIYRINNNILAAMGVINITPNSFSDGNESFSELTVREKILSMKDLVEVLDFGAESTAPMNESISWKEEFNRLDNFLFPNLKTIDLTSKVISIDTYHEETFLKAYEFIKAINPNQKIFWNDVSGKDSIHLKELFKDQHFSYVLCHNLAPKREISIKHMDFCSTKDDVDFIDEVYDFFKNFLAKYESRKQIVIDPCFGFSKSREQNHYLLKHLAELILKFHFDYSVVIGISRKSFLRNTSNTNIKDPLVQRHTDLSQAIIIHHFLQKIQNRTICARLHNPLDMQSIDFASKIIT